MMKNEKELFNLAGKFRAGEFPVKLYQFCKKFRQHDLIYCYIKSNAIGNSCIMF